MEEMVRSAGLYLLNALIATLLQLLVLLGPLLILALFMNLIASATEKTATAVFGHRTFLYGFRWLGTPVHELGHALFALLFLHRIAAIKLFDPAAKDGSYGFVNHSFNRRNIYQQTGNFFIGMGPIIMGSVILFLMAWLLFGIGPGEWPEFDITPATFSGSEEFSNMVVGLLQALWTLTGRIFAGDQSAWWKILLLIYLMFAVGSSMTLSPSDIRGSFTGFLYFCGLLLIINLATLWIGDFLFPTISRISTFFSGFYFLMVFSMGINLCILLILVISRIVIERLRQRMQ